jgi:hypothetical protein
MPVRTGIARFKLVISATREGVQLYPSVEDLPGERQRQAKRALDGDLAATLLIADKAGLSRMRRLLAQTENAERPVRAPANVARQVGLSFLACGLVLLALLLWVWLR